MTHEVKERIVSERHHVEKLIQAENPGLLSKLNKDRRKEVVEATLLVSQRLLCETSMHSGPIPSADELAKYNELIPQGADRIMQMAEKQSEHRQQLERFAVGSQLSNASRGQIFAFILALLLIITAVYAMILEQTEVAITIFTVTIVGLVSVFIIGKKQEKKSLKDKG